MSGNKDYAFIYENTAEKHIKLYGIYNISFFMSIFCGGRRIKLFSKPAVEKSNPNKRQQIFLSGNILHKKYDIHIFQMHGAIESLTLKSSTLCVHIAFGLRLSLGQRI